MHRPSCQDDDERRETNLNQDTENTHETKIEKKDVFFGFCTVCPSSPPL